MIVCNHNRPHIVVPFLLSLAVLTLATTTVRAEDPPSAVGPVMKLFKSGRLPPERQGTVVEMICNRGNEHDLRVVFDQLMMPEGFAPDLRLKVIGWLSDAASTRKVNPTGDLSAFTKLISSKETQVRLAAIRAAAAWKLVGALGELQSIATGADVVPELQKAAIEGLVSISGVDSKSTLLKLSAKDQPMTVRMQAIAALVGVDLPTASEQAAAALASSTTADKPNTLLNAFFDRKDGTETLARSEERRVGKECCR